MSSKIDYKEINKLIGLMEEKNLSHFELEVEGLKIKISRSPAPSSPSESSPDPQASAELEGKENSMHVKAPPQDEENNLHYITSPMVGIFYRTPAPSSPPFVETGDQVEKNQTLCLIEAMKLMNEIESDIDGTLTKIFIENGKPVEYGQRLFAIQPSP